jgi:glucose/arabinose dehydrogenase
VRTTPRPAVVALVLVTALAAGCGDDDGSRAATQQPSATIAPPTTAPPTTTDAPPSSAPSTSTPPTTVPVPLEEVAVTLTEVAVADQPVDVVVRPGSGSLHVVERVGAVRPLGPDGLGPPVVDISDDTVAEGERGLLGAAFSPDGSLLYLSYTDLEGDSRLHEWRMAGDAVDPASRREVLTQPQPFSNHNGGHITFGPDGLLWYGLGDGGSSGDPGNRAQDTTTLLGKILRIDPAAQATGPYGVPGDNPFAAGGGRGEIAVYGLRNPWRFSFDRDTGALWIADVGERSIEEVTPLPAGGILGANLGWNRLEGSRSFAGEPPAGAVGPVHEYGRDEGISVTGGVGYRGDAIPGLAGAYLFGDLATAQVWALPTDGTTVGERVPLGVGVEPGTLVSFAEDEDGEVYVVSIGGPVSRLDPA